MKKHSLQTFLLFIFLINCKSFISAQSSPISLWNQWIINEPDLTPSKYFLAKSRPGTQKNDLESQQILLVRKLDSDFAIFRAESIEILEKTALFINTFKINNLWKLNPTFRQLYGSEIKVFTLQSLSPETTLLALHDLPEVAILKTRDEQILIRTNVRLVTDLLIHFEEVYYIGVENQTPKEESRVLDLNLTHNTINQIHHFFPALAGQNKTLSIQELAFAADDLDLRGRTVGSPLSADQTSDHATEMATIAAGAGNSSLKGKGVASAAGLSASDFSDVLPDADEDYLALGISVQNHSYGTSIENFYGTMAAAFDQSAHHIPTLLHVFSSGNQGTDTGDNGTYQGVPAYANLTGNYKMSKNTLTVGSMDSIRQAVDFSSRGPAYDGRVKPEVVAYSTAGSSNSAALVSGVALLLQQAYEEQTGSLLPSALLKALLINSARDVGPEGLNFITGYGNVDAYRALQDMWAHQYFTGALDAGESSTFNISVPADASELKITLVWNDAPAMANANIALVNDLDLSLQAGTESWLPWVLNTEADPSLLAQPAFRAADHLNNVEQISLPSPAAGTYTLKIQAYDIPEGPQPFFVVYQWDTLDRFTWTFPTGSDNMPFDGESDTYFLWKSSLPDSLGRLEYSLDQGNSWAIIQQEVSLKKEQYRWKAPELTTTAIARMVVDGTAYPTEPFTISRPQSIGIGFNCTDSVMIRWEPLANAIAYEVSTLGATTMEKIFTATDPYFIFQKEDYSSPFFAVQPLLTDLSATRSLTFNYASQGVDCFLANFYPELLPETGIYLHLDLGTTYGVKDVIFDRWNGSAYEPIGLLPAQATHLRFLDEQPRQGLNQYQARIQLQNGGEIISDNVTIYFLKAPPFLVFPNPLPRSGTLNIFTKPLGDEVPTFQLYNSTGKIFVQHTFLSNREAIPLPNLAPGLYYYRFEGFGTSGTGKIVVE